jgi:hypothetical protein
MYHKKYFFLLEGGFINYGTENSSPPKYDQEIALHIESQNYFPFSSNAPRTAIFANLVKLLVHHTGPDLGHLSNDLLLHVKLHLGEVRVGCIFVA